MLLCHRFYNCDSKDSTLDIDDILHYQKIIVALTQTQQLMTEIDKIKIE
jgi:hypothetical protein